MSGIFDKGVLIPKDDKIPDPSFFLNKSRFFISTNRTDRFHL